VAIQLLIPRPGGCYSQSNRFASNCALAGQGPPGLAIPAPCGGTRGCQRDAVPAGFAGWVAPSVPAAGGTSWAAACRRLFFGRAPTRQLLSHQLTNSWGLAGIWRRGVHGLVTWLLGCHSLRPGCAWLFCSRKSPLGPSSPLPGSRLAASPAKSLGAWVGVVLGCSALPRASPPQHPRHGQAVGTLLMQK